MLEQEHGEGRAEIVEDRTHHEEQVRRHPIHDR
jgi:hypothetical protein